MCAEKEALAETTLTRKQIFQGTMLELVVDDVRLPDGNTARRELIFHPGAVGIIPFVAQQNKLILVKQFRKPLEKVTLEIPAGKIDTAEERLAPLKTAQRELEEETAFVAETWQLLTKMYVSPGYSNECLYLYLAEGLTKVAAPREQDVDEFLELVELTLEEAQQAALAGLICDAKTLFALQYLQMRQLLNE